MILVVGATGMVGGQVCRRLVAGGLPVRALVRPTTDPSRVRALEAIGVDAIVGDVRDRASLDAACRDVRGVVCTVSSMPVSYVPGVNDIASVDRDGVRSLIDAARAAGASRFVYVSFSGNLDLDFPLRNAKRDVEAYLRSSGLGYTILRPSCFMEVWLTPAVGFDPANARATVYGAGTSPISWISASDVATFAALSLDAPAALNATLELGGPEPIAPLDVVRTFERIGGRAIEITHVPDEALLAQQQAATDPMAQSFAALMRCCARGDAIDMTSLLRSIPVRLTTVESFAASTLAATPAAVH